MLVNKLKAELVGLSYNLWVIISILISFWHTWFLFEWARVCWHTHSLIHTFILSMQQGRPLKSKLLGCLGRCHSAQSGRQVKGCGAHCRWKYQAGNTSQVLLYLFMNVLCDIFLKRDPSCISNEWQKHIIKAIFTTVKLLKPLLLL